ncbi:uncharacterized protein LOC135821711 [Sycon ciliatum]|uniref:uncharacterized protein LOC135821711 n=1 Tax=Sycon ciliatum TaxID=27933 RepID=UPI0031F6DF83|eukprot:scpid26367/ scgid26929/ 
MSKLLLVIRLLFTAQLLYVAIDFSTRTVLSLAAVLVVFYVTQEPKKTDHEAGDNPFRARTKSGEVVSTSEDAVPEATVASYRQQIAEFVLSADDPVEASAIHHFLPVQQHTECIFAKSARLWGARDWNHHLSFEENVERSIPALIKFCAIGLHCQLDGFVFELPSSTFGTSPEVFGRGVRRLLTCLSDSDPAGVHCMRRSYIGGRGWFYEFARTPIFVTTFAPCYADNHSRHAFGVDGCFVLLQPEYSFAAKNLPADTPDTNWTNPQTVRDRIRVAYRQAGREYIVRDTVYYSPALDIVKPLAVDTDEVVQWWSNTKTD